MIPVPVGTTEDIRALRSLLEASGFTEREICRWAGVPTIYAFTTAGEGRGEIADPATPLEALIRLFMDGDGLARPTLDRLLPPPGSGVLERLGLLVADARDPARRGASVLLYPTEGFYIVSDRDHPFGAAAADGPTLDAVYPAVTANTANFLATLPRTPCDAFLDLCAGTGIAAFIAARNAAGAVAVDLNERAVRFAEFNASLNGIGNVEVLQGDLYEPVQGRTFDRIVAHPPYIPSLEQKYLFRDGGDDGEAITRRVIAGLPAFLRPGGSFYCTCMVTDRSGAPLEHRIRELLGERSAEFDVAVVAAEPVAPRDYYLRQAVAGQMSADEARRWQEHFSRIQVTALVYGTILVRRHSAARTPVTIRRSLGTRIANEDLEWLMRWEAASADPGAARRLLEARPRLTPAASLRVEHRCNGGRWEPASFRLVNETPFPTEVECSPEAAEFLARCDGTASVREHLEWLRTRGAAGPQASELEFAELIRSLAARRILLFDDSAPAAD